jgi:hypothetical protein
MLEKNEFFKLGLSDQKRLQAFMILLTASSVVQGLFQFPSSDIPSWIRTPLATSNLVELLLSILLLCLSIYIAKAPNFFFQLIIPFFWIALIVSGYYGVIGLAKQQFTIPLTYFSMFHLFLAIFFWKSVMSYRNAVIAAKKQRAEKK